jgi:hypothetical protein
MNESVRTGDESTEIVPVREDVDEPSASCQLQITKGSWA